MKPRLSMLIAFAAVVALAACQKEPATSSQANSTPGKVIYDQQCAICHGKAGKGDTMIANSYKNSDLTDGVWGYGGTRDELVASVTDGVPKTPMRGFKGALTENEIDQVVDYIQTLD